MTITKNNPPDRDAKFTADFRAEAVRLVHTSGHPLCAIADRRPPMGVIHHLDRGSQYCFVAYQKLQTNHGAFYSFRENPNLQGGNMKIWGNVTILLLLTIGFVWCPLSAGSSAAHETRDASVDPGLVKAVLRETCTKDVVLLGEATHGDGRTRVLNAKIVSALIRRCGFKTVVFEASFYDAIEVNRKVRMNEALTSKEFISAFGGIWNLREETLPLLQRLYSEVLAKMVVVYGIDDQVGSAGNFYSLGAMASDLSQDLPAGIAEDCRARIKQRIEWDYDEKHPHDRQAIDALNACFVAETEKLDAHMERGVDVVADRRQMLQAFQGMIFRDFVDPDQYSPMRDLAMFKNFNWLLEQKRLKGKIIVIAANAHIAKDCLCGPYNLHAPNLGWLIKREFGSRAFSLGSTALSGTYYYSDAEPNRPITNLEAHSIEAMALRNTKSSGVLVGRKLLSTIPNLAAGAFGHQPCTGRWGDAFDGLVVFRREYAAHLMPAGSY